MFGPMLNQPMMDLRRDMVDWPLCAQLASGLYLGCVLNSTSMPTPRHLLAIYIL